MGIPGRAEPAAVREPRRELEARRDDGTTQWILLRRYRRLVATDHPQRLEAWPMHLPTAWRARLTFHGGPTDQKQSQLERRLLH